MLVNYLTYYLIFIIFASFLVSLMLVFQKKQILKLIVPIILVIFVAPLFMGYIYFAYFTSVPEILVPDLHGLTVEKSIAQLKEIGLQGKSSGSVFDMRIAEGRVVSQSPEKGRKVRQGRMVNLIISSGRQKIIVPNLLGRPVAQVKEMLLAKGLRLGKISREKVAELNSGTVLAQTPLPGEEVNIKSWISITVAEELKEKPQENKDNGGFKLW